MRLLIILLLLGCGLSPHAARAQKSADTLRVVWRDALPSLDPYATAEHTGLVLAHEVWDTLLERDPQTFQLHPLLAQSWHQLDDTTIDFALRTDVHFHDGSDFTADDVVYTVRRVLQDPQIALPSQYAFLAGAEALDASHVRLHLRHAYAPALDMVAMALPILPHAYREKIGAAAFAAAPIGTGPYRVAHVDGTCEIVLERNDAYFSGPKSKPAIRTVDIREVPDATAEVAALIDGRADFIWMFDPDRLEILDADPDVVTLRGDSLRVSYLQLDAAGRSDPTSPLTYLPVRQAIFHAINRAAIARPSLAGGTRVLDAPCFPTQFGCDAAMAVHYAYNPDQARALLQDAGYPNGFSVDLVSTLSGRDADRIVADLHAVNITARLHQPPLAEALRLSAAGRTPIFANSWGSLSINDVSAFMPPFFSGGAWDDTGDWLLQEKISEADQFADPDDRRRAYGEAIRRITEQAYFLPLHTDATNYAISHDLNFRPEPDELPRFYAASWH